MKKPLRVSIVGASGYTGGELLRILLNHPHVEIAQATSERYVGKPLTRCHPNLRKITSLTFSSLKNLEPCDLLFLCLPHGRTAFTIDTYMKIAPRLIDLSADFRLKKPSDYRLWYNYEHPQPELLEKFVYGIPELHREKMKTAQYISSAGCMATACILALYPFLKASLIDPQKIVIEGKTGSSASGNKPSEATHHPERFGVIRSFSPTSHRHTAEMIQELTFNEIQPSLSFSGTAVETVRGILATAHVWLRRDVDDTHIWKILRSTYAHEPFIRIVKEKSGIYRYPEPKILAGTNMCDIGFERDPHSNRVVIMSAIDNLMKGASGQAVQAMNIMMGWDETTGLSMIGLHP